LDCGWGKGLSVPSSGEDRGGENGGGSGLGAVGGVGEAVMLSTGDMWSTQLVPVGTIFFKESGTGGIGQLIKLTS
jgi:hypothetical protein